MQDTSKELGKMYGRKVAKNPARVYARKVARNYCTFTLIRPLEKLE